jgi:hypothetical protein
VQIDARMQHQNLSREGLRPISNWRARSPGWKYHCVAADMRRREAARRQRCFGAATGLTLALDGLVCQNRLAKKIAR